MAKYTDDLEGDESLGDNNEGEMSLEKDIENTGSLDNDIKDEELLEGDIENTEFLDDDMEEDELLDDDFEDDDFENEELLDDDTEDDNFEMDDEQAYTDEDYRLKKSTSKIGINVRDKKTKKKRRLGKKRSVKQQKKRKLIMYGMTGAVVLGIIISMIAIINKYTPTKERMSGYSYFNVTQSDDVLIMLNNEIADTTGIYDNGRLYISSDFIAQKLNQRFYFDSESNAIIYTTATDIYNYKTNTNTYTDSKGKAYSEDFNIVNEVKGKLYIDFEYVSKCSNFTYNFYQDPNRVVISNEFTDLNYITVTKDTVARYRGGIKSLVLEDVKKDTKLRYNKSIDGWVEVTTDSGFVGYIKSDCVSETFSEKKEDVYTDNISSIVKNYKISLAWFQVTNITANSSINTYLEGTQGITTISPTWYSITSNNGDMSCLATKDFVDKMHAKGLEVWPLVDDFDSSIDGVVLYSSKTTRTKMINTLINDSKKYGYDGINIDFEKVKVESAKHYLQFIRELSVACRNNNIVLSTDNYKTASYNSFYDLAEQNAFVDYLVIMGYDEHYAGSDSGSVASIGFVEEGITGALVQVSSKKLIDAIPFFTRIWTVTTANGETTTTSKAAGMQAAIDNLNANNARAIWDDSVGQYFGSYELDNAIVKIWVEEDHSIEEKMKLIQRYELAGVAEWKLGLENKSVWSVIAKYNQ